LYAHASVIVGERHRNDNVHTNVTCVVDMTENTYKTFEHDGFGVGPSRCMVRMADDTVSEYDGDRHPFIIAMGLLHHHARKPKMREK